MIFDATKDLLFQIAEPQHGYFAAWQAIAAGLNATRLPMMQSRGQIERVSRGVYRLRYYPVSDVAQFMEAVLWPQGLIGVVSHESALLLHKLSDVSPAQLHITVPKAHRVRRQTPKHLRIHHADFLPQEVELLNGVPVTTPARSIQDCFDESLPAALIRQAITDGRDVGKLTAVEARNLARLSGMDWIEPTPVPSAAT